MVLNLPKLDFLIDSRVGGNDGEGCIGNDGLVDLHGCLWMECPPLLLLWIADQVRNDVVSCPGVH